MRNLRKIIKENVRNALLEMSIVPDDNSKSKMLNTWKYVYNLMNNVKTKMDSDYNSKKGNISQKDIDDVIN